jgi:hypothetical protein
MSRHPLSRRAAVVTVLTSLTTAGLLAVVGPASAIPFEGDPSPSQCLRLQRLPGATAGENPMFASHGYVLVLSSDC